MTTIELIAALRVKLSDLLDADVPDASEYLFSETSVLEALNRAQNEFAVATLCIFDGITTTAATATSPWVALPSDTIWLRSALFGTTLLTVVTQHELDYGYFSLNGAEASVRFSDWRNKTGSTKFIVNDLGVETARLVPIPTTNGTVTLERYTLPAQLTLAVDPSIPLQFHMDLITGAAAYLYENADAETYDPRQGDLMFIKWNRVLDKAQIQLQTVLRKQERAMGLPAGVGFAQPNSNTIGSTQSSNTEAG